MAIRPCRRHVFFHQQVGIDAAKAKGADSSTAGNGVAAALPRLCPGQHLERALLQLHTGLWGAEIGSGGQGCMLHGQQYLGQGCCPGSGQQVADVGLDRADDTALTSLATLPEFLQACHFNRITNRGAGGMAFNQVNILWFPAGPLICRPHGPQLSL